MISRWVFATVCLAVCLAGTASRAADSLYWQTNQNKVDAQIQGWDLVTLLSKISRATGWKVYLEPGLDPQISCKFKNLSQDDALRHLLGNLNYSKDETNGVVRLLVAQTATAAATQFVKAAKKDYRIPNELVVKLKNGAATNNIDRLAKALGAKVLKRYDSIGLYRLQFADGSTADAAMSSIGADSSVAAVDANYSVDRPNPALLTPASGGAPSFNLSPPSNANGPVIGLIDTAAYPPGPFQNYSLNAINVTGDTEPPSADPTHGTSMFETMVEAMANDPSKILPVDVYGAGESTTSVEVMAGIVAAVNAGANPINLSLGGTGDSEMMENLIESAISKGVVFIAATGNTPGEGAVYPAGYPGVYSVTASTQTVTAPGVQYGTGGQLASYANDPSDTTAMAPGTSYIQWNGGMWVVEGTSVSTAYLSATVADYENQDHSSASQVANQIVKAFPTPR